MQESTGVSIPLPEIEHFEQRVIDAAARQLLSSSSYDEDGDEVRYRSEIGRKIEAAMVKTIKEQARDAAPDVAKAILEEGVQQTDTWGDPRGGKRSLKSVVAEEVKANLIHGSGRRGEGVLNRLIREEVEGQLRGELKAEIDAAKAPILEAVRKEATGAIERALQSALRGL